MRRALWSGIIVLAALVLVPEAAQAQPVLSYRCTVDTLDTNAKAEQRVEWARRCGLTRNVGDPSMGYNTTMLAANGIPLVEYEECDTDRDPTCEGKYTGGGRGYKVNEVYLFNIYLSGPTYQSRDTNGYMKWTRDAWRKKGRTLYPTFGSTYDITDPTNVQLFPHPTLADCNLYRDKNGLQLANGPVYVNGYCESACYPGDQKLLFSQGYVPILEALEARREDLITLTPSSTLDNLQLQQNRTYSYTVETRDALHDLYVIRTESGGELRVTIEHPVLLSEGRMVQAQTLKVGHELLRVDGSADRIVSIEKIKHFGKVYNISPVTTDLVSNVVVAQGFLVGSVRFQNDEVAYMNRIILYRSVPNEVIP